MGMDWPEMVFRHHLRQFYLPEINLMTSWCNSENKSYTDHLADGLVLLQARQGTLLPGGHSKKLESFKR